jgi:co-chaperonin GroES (HSP10)
VSASNRQDALRIAAEIEELAKIGKKYTLIGPRIAIVREGAVEKIGKLFVPEEAKEKKLAGTIVMLGNGINSGPEAHQFEGLRAGQWVTFNKYNGVEHKIRLSDREVIIEVLHARDIYIVWEGTDEVSPFEENPLTATKEELG